MKDRDADLGVLHVNESKVANGCELTACWDHKLCWCKKQLLTYKDLPSMATKHWNWRVDGD